MVQEIVQTYNVMQERKRAAEPRKTRTPPSKTHYNEFDLPGPVRTAFFCLISQSLCCCLLVPSGLMNFCVNVEL